MHTYRMKVITALCSSMLVGGCAFFRPSPLQLATAPFSLVKDSSSSTRADYQAGRAMRGQSDYQKAIEKNPADAEAHNGLGVIYAMQGKNEQAIKELMEAAALAPKAAYIQNNLGFAYLLSGRNADAMATLTVAAGLDPANERIRENLKKAQVRIPVVPPAPEPLLDVIAAAAHPAPRADSAVDPNAPTLVSVAPNIFELRQNLPRTHAAPSIASAPPAMMKIEIANGNGVAGLAKRTSSFLQQKGYAIARLTNQAPYTQSVTEIQYRPGQESAARHLTGLMSVPANVVESKQLSATVGVRLVLGRDVMQGSLFTERADTQNAIAHDERVTAGRG